MKNRWTSRKFLVAFTAQLAAIGVLIWPQHGDAITNAMQSITALVIIALTSMGYVAAEANHTPDRKLKRELLDIFGRIEQLLYTYTDED